jgi:hypothetical protein
MNNSSQYTYPLHSLRRLSAQTFIDQGKTKINAQKNKIKATKITTTNAIKKKKEERNIESKLYFIEDYIPEHFNNIRYEGLEMTDTEFLEKAKTIIKKSSLKHIIKFFNDNQNILEPLICNLSIELGRFDVLKWARENNYNGNETTTCSCAAFNGQLKILQWLRNQNPPCPWNATTCSEAARGGHLKILQWLRNKTETNEILNQERENNNDICPWSIYTCAMAAKGGHFEILQWLRNENIHGNNICPWDTNVWENAAYSGNLEILQWIRTQVHPPVWTSHACSMAAKGGHLEILQWLRNQNPPCPWRFHVCRFAALGGHLDVLEWAHDNGCPWNNHVCRAAALGGHLNILQWLRNENIHGNNICDWDVFVCENAAYSGHLELLQWAINNDCPYNLEKILSKPNSLLPEIREYLDTLQPYQQDQDGGNLYKKNKEIINFQGKHKYLIIILIFIILFACIYPSCLFF